MKNLHSFLLVNFTIASCLIGSAQSGTEINKIEFSKKDSITKGVYTLIFINKDSAFSDVTKQRMTEAFFTVYPQLVQRFNADARKKVVFIIDPGYKGVAATSGGVIRYNPQWLKDHPSDIDVVTHEIMHVVQAYGSGGGPGWLTEGIADYVRNQYGVANTAGGWSMPDYNPKQNYNNSYRITARFLTWLEKNVKSNLVNELDAVMRSHSYNEEIWKKLTGKTIEELWTSYSQNPAL